MRLLYLRKNYFNKLINYMKNVYHIENGLKKLSDGRINPTYKTGKVVLLVLLGFLLRVKSFNELNLVINNGEFNKLFSKCEKLPKVDTIRDTLKVVNIKGLKQINEHIVKKAIENKVFENGTKYFGSNKKSCPECLKNKNHCFHSGAVMAVVGEGPKLVIDFENYKLGQDSVSKDEGELNVAKRLLANVVSAHKRLIDIVVYDALACNSVWINHCKNYNIDVVVRVKNNNNNSIREVKKKANKSETIEVWRDEKGFEKVDVYEEIFTMDNVKEPLRFVKYTMKYPNKKRSQIMILTTCMDTDLKTLFKIIKARWNIENSIFNKLKKEAGLEHCYVHGGKAVEAVISLIFIASNIMQLFLHRRLKNHYTTEREVIRLLLKGLYLLKYRSEIVFNTT